MEEVASYEWRMTSSHRVVPHGASLKISGAMMKSLVVRVDISSRCRSKFNTDGKIEATKPGTVANALRPTYPDQETFFLAICSRVAFHAAFRADLSGICISDSEHPCFDGPHCISWRLFTLILNTPVLVGSHWQIGAAFHADSEHPCFGGVAKAFRGAFHADSEHPCFGGSHSGPFSPF